MKEVTIYVSFDGKEFPTKKDCEEYELYMKDKGLEEMYKRLNQMKAGKGCDYSLWSSYKTFMNAKKAYLETCEKKFSEEVRLERFMKYMERKKRYMSEWDEYNKLKKKIFNLKYGKK